MATTFDTSVNGKSSSSGWGIGVRLSATACVLIALVFAGFTIALSLSVSSLLKQRAFDEISGKSKLVVQMMEVFDTNLGNEVQRFAKLLGTNFPDKFVADSTAMVTIGDKSVPTLRNGASAINLDFSIVDRFTSQTGVTATIFVKSGSDFVRISTSVKKENGERAVGTVLDRAHAGYPVLMQGQTYRGSATLFGAPFMTQYDPIKDDQGNIVGVLYVGVNVSANLKALKDNIKSIRVGDTGYFYAIDTKAGKTLGNLAIHPSKEGQNVLDAKDADDREFIKEILEKKEGMFTHRVDDNGSGKALERVVIFAPVKSWNWIVAGGTTVDEITRDVSALRNLYSAIGLFLVLGITAVLYVTVRNMVIRPLDQAVGAAQRLSQGDLTTQIDVARRDEIGQLMQSINGVSRGLSKVIGNVRQGTELIAVSSREIASGNSDLSSRTESQASSLEETVASMEELTTTVRQNADNAKEANRLVASSADLAAKGGDVVHQVIGTMTSIKESSSKIVDIIGVIDGIAFQTNILALNAAVEAARAGEQGRGFAVVAAEVRNLAQRSAAAAKEIKTLISTSVGNVDAGSKLVDQAGGTMQEIVASVAQVATIMNEIATASHEQSAGIDGINRAIGQMDEVTQQNAALAEQAAAAAQSMQNQTDTLSKAVAAFKLGQT